VLQKQKKARIREGSAALAILLCPDLLPIECRIEAPCDSQLEIVCRFCNTL
jgi:hypothetical protein